MMLSDVAMNASCDKLDDLNVLAISYYLDQCKEMEENNRVGTTRDLLKKIRDTKGAFHAKMGMIKNRSYMNLTDS